MVKNIAIVGAGQLGSRYLQGLVNSHNKLSIWVVDLSSDALDLARNRWIDSGGLDSSNKVSFLNSLHQLPQSLEVVIVSTTANVRADVVEIISLYCNVRYWILEKVLAQSNEDLDLLLKCTSNSHGIWVNMPIRTMSWHKQIKTSLNNNVIHSIKMTGGSWGMACNVIHYLDLFSFLSNSELLSLNTCELNKFWSSSKRHNFYEIYGVLSAKFSNNIDVLFEAVDDKSPTIIEINASNGLWIINENDGIAHGPLGQKITGRFEFQSEMTAPLIDSILDTGCCSLPDIHWSIYLHRLLINSLLSHWNLSNNVNDRKLPIT